MNGKAIKAPYSMKTSSIYIILILWICSFTSLAQNKPYNYNESRFNPYLNRFSVSIGLGTSLYDGEFAGLSNAVLQNYYLNPGGGVGLSYRFFERISLRAEINFFRLSAKSSFTPVNRSREFSSFNFDYYINAVIDIFRQSRIDGRFRKWNPYVFGGIGQVAFFPSHNLEGGLEGGDIGIDTTYLNYNYSNFSLIYPVGVGISYYFDKYHRISLEGNYRFTKTDFLDGYKSQASPNLDKYLTVFVKYTFVIDPEPRKSFSYQKYIGKSKKKKK
jgi:hypothetical protein